MKTFWLLGRDTTLHWPSYMDTLELRAVSRQSTAVAEDFTTVPRASPSRLNGISTENDVFQQDSARPNRLSHEGVPSQDRGRDIEAGYNAAGTPGEEFAVSNGTKANGSGPFFGGCGARSGVCSLV